MLSIDVPEQPPVTRLRQTYRPPRVTNQVEGGDEEDEEDEDCSSETAFNPTQQEPHEGSSSKNTEIPHEIDIGRLRRRQIQEPQHSRRNHTLPALPVRSFSHHSSYGGGQAIQYGRHPGGYFNKPNSEDHSPQAPASYYGYSGIPYPPPYYPPYQYPGYSAGPSYQHPGHDTSSKYGPVYPPSTSYAPSTYGSNSPFSPQDQYLHQPEQQLPIQASLGLDRETLEIKRENYELKQEARETLRQERKKLRAKEEARIGEREEAEREQAKIDKENKLKLKKQSKKAREKEKEIRWKENDIHIQNKTRQAETQAQERIAADQKEEPSHETQKQRPRDDTGRILFELLKFMETRFGGPVNQTLPTRSVSNASIGTAARDRGRTELWRKNLEQANFDGLMRLHIEEIVEDVLRRHSETSQNGDFEINDGFRAFTGTPGFHPSSNSTINPNDRLSFSELSDIVNRMGLSLHPKFDADNLHSQIPRSPQTQPSVKSFHKSNEPPNREEYFDGYESASNVRNCDSWNDQDDTQFAKTRRRVGKGAAKSPVSDQLREDNDHFTDESEDQGPFSRRRRRYAAVRPEKERRGNRGSRKSPPSVPPVPDPPPKKRGSEEFRYKVLHD
ncbi:hypothetical protein BGZ60DRAFT_511965 [Tricladium varicosporioides]|nr:hypothetical protein BGZ60DRAFT_511965 [Hymenoscyphus varicosporioides]